MDKADADATLKVPSIDSRVTITYSASNQRLCREIIIWKHLSHADIMPPAGCSCIWRSTLLAHPHRVDAQRERDPVHEIESEREPFAIGELACCVPVILHTHQRPSALRGDIWCGLPPRT